MTTILNTTDRGELIDMYWDMYKEAYGIRPRHVDFERISIEEMKSDLENLFRVMEENAIQRAESEKRAAAWFESRVADLIETGADDRETALRWIHEAEGTNGDDDYLCWTVGLPYGYFKKAVV